MNRERSATFGMYSHDREANDAQTQSAQTRHLAFNGGGGVDCTVRNISSGGARLDVANPVGLPQSFTLVIQTDHFVRHCHPVWCNDTRIGVAFD